MSANVDSIAELLFEALITSEAKSLKALRDQVAEYRTRVMQVAPFPAMLLEAIEEAAQYCEPFPKQERFNQLDKRYFGGLELNESEMNEFRALVNEGYEVTDL